MDRVNLLGAHSIQILQEFLPNATNYFSSVSRFADPANGFSVIFPLCCVFSLPLGANVLTACMLAEWMNVLLKWFLMEHRPYWWVNLRPGRPVLRQSKLTCETGPGSPSGHLTGITVASFIIAQWLCRYINEETLIGRTYKRRLNKLVWFVAWIILVNVMLSRMYLAAHFPHQCILGIAAGYFVVDTVSKCSKWWMRASKPEWMLLTFISAIISTTAYLLQFLIGVNPDWSIQLASKWCSKSEYLHVSTMPLFTLVRDISACFGIVLSSPLSRRLSYRYSNKVSAVLSFFTYIWFNMSAKQIPTTDAKVFYTIYFLLSAVHVYFTLEIIPYTSHLFMSFFDFKKK